MSEGSSAGEGNSATASEPVGDESLGADGVSGSDSAAVPTNESSGSSCGEATIITSGVVRFDLTM